MEARELKQHTALDYCVLGVVELSNKYLSGSNHLLLFVQCLVYYFRIYICMRLYTFRLVWQIFQIVSLLRGMWHGGFPRLDRRGIRPGRQENDIVAIILITGI